MGSEVNLLTLGDVCYITDGAHSKVERQVSGVMYLTSKNIGSGQLKLDNFDFISESCFLKLFTNTRKAQRRLQAGDVLMGIIGTFGNYYLYKKTDHFGISSSIAILRAEPSKLLPEYLCYYISSNSFKNIVEKFKGGSVQGYTNISTLKALPIPVPSLDIQKKIVSNLTPIDSKISLNHQINQTLEQMAQTLFKSWFVDFDPVIDNALDAGFFEQDLAFSDELLRRVELRKAVRKSDSFKPLSENIRQLFPNTFEECAEPALGLGGWVPKGWESLPVGSLIELIGGGTPKTSESSYWGGDIPWFSVVDAPNDSDVFVMDTEKKITELGIQNSSAKILKVGSTIISARGTVGKCALVAKPMAINQSCYGIVGKNGVHDYFIYYLVRHSVSHLQQRSHGSVFSTITRDTFNSFNFIFSGQLIANAFGETISFWFEKIDKNNQQNYILHNLRDTLLPKLISGELSLSDIKIDTPEETLI
ncbi:restriction endonuclease subunit S [Providencia stuartii]|nr:restriction endonuclease subunit S [Providencia stuartii]